MLNKDYEIYKTVARNIKKYRKLKNITQKELAKRSGISYEYIRRIEAPNMKSTYSLKVISNIAKALKIEEFLLFIKKER